MTRSTIDTKKATTTLELDALGTHWWIELLTQTFTPELARIVTSEILTFQETYTRFKDTSLVGQLNRQKYLHQPPAELIAMLQFARRLQHETAGVFNISVGGELVRRGYGPVGQGSISATFWDEVKFTPDEIRIPGEISLDFGGFGKGWLIDKLGHLLEKHDMPYYIVNGGGDVLVSSPEPVELSLEHPLDSTKAIGTTKISRGALAVSSSIKRSWEKDGRIQHHIIDPRSGRPSDSDVVSTYVRAETALLADVCATVLLIAPEFDAQLSHMYQLKTILLTQRHLYLSS